MKRFLWNERVLALGIVLSLLVAIGLVVDEIGRRDHFKRQLVVLGHEYEQTYQRYKELKVSAALRQMEKPPTH